MFGFSVGTWEILIVVLVILLVFGGKELPRIVRSVANAWRSIRNLSNKTQKEIEDIFRDDDWKG